MREATSRGTLPLFDAATDEKREAMAKVVSLFRRVG
jgi:hypothetical protein